MNKKNSMSEDATTIQPNLNHVQNIFLIGPPGAGKSTIGQQLAKKLNWHFYDSDKVLEARAGVSISWIFEIEGEAAFRQRESKIIDELTSHQHVIVATGAGAITLPATRHFLADRGLVIYMHAEIETLAKRVMRHREHRPLLQVENLQEKVASLVAERQALYHSIADIEVVTENKEIEDLVNEIITKVHTHLK